MSDYKIFDNFLPDNEFQAIYNTVKKADTFYSVILSERNLKPDEVIHVGDSYKYDYEEAKKIGITAYYLDWDKEMNGDYVVHSLVEFMEKVNNVT